MRRILTAIVVGTAWWLLAVPVHAVAPVDLRAEAGLGGTGRPGRWTPVRVTIATADVDLSGELVLEWGDTRLRRDVDLAAPSQTVLELYLRTADVRGSITVRLVSNGSAVAAVDVPIRMIPEDERLVVCVGDVAASVACTASVDPIDLPQSLRGYVAADDVRVPAGVEASLAPEQRSALELWRVYRDRNEQGLLTQAPRAPLQAAAAGGIPTATLVASATASLSFLGAVWWSARGSRSPRSTYAAMVGALVVGGVGAGAAGRLGPGASILVRHATTVQQLGDSALVSMRGTIEYPAFDRYVIRLSPVDAAVTERFAPDNQHSLDVTGSPIRRGTFGRARREEVDIEAVAAYAPFEVGLSGDLVRVANRSSSTLSGCRFPEGFSGPESVQLPPGGSVTARVTSPGDAPFFSCESPAPPLVLTDAGFPLRLEGVTLVSVLLPVSTGEAHP